MPDTTQITGIVIVAIQAFMLWILSDLRNRISRLESKAMGSNGNGGKI